MNPNFMQNSRSSNTKCNTDFYNRENQRQLNYMLNTTRNINYTQPFAIPNKGINMGYRPYSVMSKNPIDVENDLFNLTNRNSLCDSKYKHNTEYLPKEMTCTSFYKEPKYTYIPEPLVVENGQRPFRP